MWIPSRRLKRRFIFIVIPIQWEGEKSVKKKIEYTSHQVFVGKAQVLHEELMKHFDCFGKTRKEIREIYDELYHHTTSTGWEVRDSIQNSTIMTSFL